MEWIPMLRELHISNLAVISDAKIELGAGLNCFTGATGAGKSLIIGAVELLRHGDVGRSSGIGIAPLVSQRCNMPISRHRIATLLVGLLVGVMAGCADHPSEVPPDGVKVAEGNQKLLYKAPEAGTIFVFESPDNRLIYRGEIKKGDSVELNTNDDRISVNGKTVMEKGLGTGHNYKMFFDPAGSRKVVVERRTETISR